MQSAASAASIDFLMPIMKKKLPTLETDEEAEGFVANADLTEYDLSQFRTVLFEIQPKTERVNMRLPKTLLDAVKESAAKAGVPINASFARSSNRPSGRRPDRSRGDGLEPLRPCKPSVRY